MNTKVPPLKLWQKQGAHWKGWGEGRAGPPPVTGGVWEMVSLLPGAPTPMAGEIRGPGQAEGYGPLCPGPPEPHPC